jgi:hypothetical protein
MPFSALRTRRMVDAPTGWPSFSSSPWILLYPQPLFSVASRSISADRDADPGAEPRHRRRDFPQRSHRDEFGFVHGLPLQPLADGRRSPSRRRESRGARHFRVPAWHSDRHTPDRAQPQADGDLALSSASLECPRQPSPASRTPCGDRRTGVGERGGRCAGRRAASRLGHVLRCAGY